MLEFGKDYYFRYAVYPDVMKPMKVCTTGLRLSEPIDRTCLRRWLTDKETLRWFPCYGDSELNHMVGLWSEFFRLGASLTCFDENTREPTGIATLLLNPFKKICHTCDFSIIVDPKNRNEGIGGFLLDKLQELAKDKFNIKHLTLQVYDKNPAINLYYRKGFSICGRQKDFVLDGDKYLDKIYMEKKLYL